MGWIIFFKRTLAFKIFHEKTKVITVRLSILPVTFSAHESLLAYSPMLRGAWRIDAGSGAFRTSLFLFNWTMMPFFYYYSPPVSLVPENPACDFCETWEQYQSRRLVLTLVGNFYPAEIWLYCFWVKPVYCNHKTQEILWPQVSFTLRLWFASRCFFKK